MVYPLNVHFSGTHSWGMEKISPSALSFRETEMLQFNSPVYLVDIIYFLNMISF